MISSLTNPPNTYIINFTKSKSLLMKYTGGTTYGFSDTNRVPKKRSCL